MGDMWSIFFIIAVGGTAATLWKPKSGLMFPLVAFIGWIAIWITLFNNPPMGLTAGSPEHVAIQFAPWVAAIGTVLYSILIPTRQTRKWGDAFSVEESGYHLPSFLGGKHPEDEEKERNQRGMSARDVRNKAYRERTKRAYSHKRR